MTPAETRELDCDQWDSRCTQYKMQRDEARAEAELLKRLIVIHNAACAVRCNGADFLIHLPVRNKTDEQS